MKHIFSLFDTQNPESTEKRIKASVFVLGLLMLLVFMRWQYYMQPGVWSVAFTDRIFQTGVVEDVTLITTTQRVIYFAILQLSSVFGLLAVYNALRWCYFGLVGVYIAHAPLGAIRNVGFWTILSIASSVLAPVVIRPLLSWNNPSGLIGPVLYFHSTELFLGLCGFAFLIIGWVLSQALKLKEENEAFV